MGCGGSAPVAPATVGEKTRNDQDRDCKKASVNDRDKFGKNDNSEPIRHVTNQENVSKKVRPEPKLHETDQGKVIKKVSSEPKNPYAEVDAHALRAPKSARNSTEQLAEYLSQGLTDPLLIARSFYRWIAENIKYDTDSFFGHVKRDVDSASVLQSGSSLCAGYANLFSDLCKHAGIIVKTISGFSKGYGHNPQSAITYRHETDHEWNAIKINNKWQFVECTWGSGYTDENREFQKKFDDFYFLTDPKHFIVAHFPFFDDDITESSKWQLLDKPWTIEEFNKAVNLSMFAMKWGLKFSNTDAIVSVNKTVDIIIEDPRKVLIDMTVHLQSVDGRNQDRYVFLRREKSNVYTATMRPPNKGIFKLRLFGKVDKETETLDEMVGYVLDCITVDHRLRPYPKHSGLWGASLDALHIGFHMSVASPASYKAEKGKLSLLLKTNRQIRAMICLRSSSSSDELDNYALLQAKEDCLKIHLRLPKPDFYSLDVLCKTDDNGLYHRYITYLIQSDFEQVDTPQPFPKIYPRAKEYHCELIEPLDGILPARTEIRVKLRSPKLVQAMVGGKEMTLNNEVWEAKVTTPHASDAFDIRGNEINENSNWHLYSYQVVKN